MLLDLYRWLSDAAGLAAPGYLSRRAARGKEDPTRLGERFGRTGMPRPAGSVIWLHAASVGESLSLLPVIERLRLRVPHATVLMTTGTLTSARLMEERLTSGALHQFVPIDLRSAVRRFLDHWRPDLAIFVESELWPNLLHETAARRVPIILLNGRLSLRSFRRWQGWPHLGRQIFKYFAVIQAQDATQAARFAALGARQVVAPGDLKAAMLPPPADPALLPALREAIGGRPVWLAASTHPGEEAIALAAHRALEADHPGLLTFLAPRHPNRAAAIAMQIDQAGLRHRRRSSGMLPAPDTAVYLIDTLGELGTFSRTAPIVLVAGSLAAEERVGGHNPLEAAALGCAVLHGLDTANSAAVTALLDEAGAAQNVDGTAGLVTALDTLLRDPARVAAMGEAGRKIAAAQSVVIDRVMESLEPWLGVL